MDTIEVAIYAGLSKSTLESSILIAGQAAMSLCRRILREGLNGCMLYKHEKYVQEKT